MQSDFAEEGTKLGAASDNFWERLRFVLELLFASACFLKVSGVNSREQSLVENEIRWLEKKYNKGLRISPEIYCYLEHTVR